jgi:hypothetical protein
VRGGSENVVGLITRRLCVLKAACSNEFRDEIELLNQRIVELASTLVSGKFLMPVGGDFQRIPCDEHGARLLFAVEAQQKVRKAKNGTGRLPAVPQNRLRQGMVGAMGE